MVAMGYMCQTGMQQSLEEDYDGVAGAQADLNHSRVLSQDTVNRHYSLGVSYFLWG